MNAFADSAITIIYLSIKSIILWVNKARPGLVLGLESELLAILEHSVIEKEIGNGANAVFQS